MLSTELRKIFTAIFIISIAILSTPAHAVNEAMLDLLKILRDKGSLTSEEYELLRSTALSDGEKVEGKVSEMQGKLDKETKKLPKISTKGKLQFETEEHKFRIGGRIMHDVTLVNNDGAGNVGSSEQQFRRARIFLSGTAWKHWDWKFQYDLEDADDTGQAVEDAYIRYTGIDNLAITVGQRKAPFSLNELNSSNKMTFIERAVPSNIFAGESFGIANRTPGITLSTKGKQWTAEGGFYMMRQQDTAERKIDDGYGFTGRATFLPIKEKDKLVHLGAALGYKHYANRSINRVRTRPAVSEGDRIVDSDGAIAADSFWAIGLEAATIWGPFSAQAEYYHGEVDTIATAGSNKLDGWYLQGSYFLTGEGRRYKGNKFSGVKVKNPVGSGWGAWEIALRYSSTDLGAAVGDDEGDVLTAALNWYVNNNMMFKFNYVKTFCDNSLNSGNNCDWGVGDGEPSYFAFRTQFFF